MMIGTLLGIWAVYVIGAAIVVLFSLALQYGKKGKIK